MHAAQVEEEREANEAVLALRRTLRRVGSENQEAMQIPSKLSQSLPSEASQARISNGHDSAQNAAGSETSAAARPRSRLQHFATTASRLRMAASRAKQVLKNSQSQSTEMGVWSALDQQRSAVLRHHYGKLHNTLGSSALNVSDPEQVLMLDECAHFAGFAIAASGWRYVPPMLHALTEYIVNHTSTLQTSTAHIYVRMPLSHVCTCLDLLVGRCLRACFSAVCDGIVLLLAKFPCRTLCKA